MAELGDICISLPNSATAELADPSLSLFWANFADRTIWITSEINEDTMALIDYILLFNREDKGKAINERKPIKILINSQGGSLDIADSIVSVIEASTTPIYGYAMGLVASAASLIYLATHKRFALKTSYLLIHKGSCNVGSNYNELMAMMDDYRDQIEKMITYYVSHSTMEESFVKEKIQTDWYVRGDKLLEYGLIHQWLTSLDEVLDD